MNGSAKQTMQSKQRKTRKFFALSFALCVVRCPLWGASEAYYNYLRGMVEEEAGHTAKALDAYEKVVQEDPHALEVFRDIAELRLRMGQPDAALVAAEHIQELAPTDPTSFIFLGNVFVAQGNLAKAADAYEKALTLDPSNVRALENLGNYYALLDPDKALSYYQRYIDVDPNDPDIYFQMALLYQKRGKQAKALPLYQKSLELDPQQLASHLALADLYENQYSTASAIVEYQTAAQMQPDNPLLFMRLGNLYYRDGQWDKAAEALKAAQKLSPQDSAVYYWLARTDEERKMWKEAADAAEKAYTLTHDPQFLPLTAYYLTLDRQIDKAIMYLEKARETDPNSANVLLFLGMDYADSDKLEKAHEALAKGVSLYPKDPQLLFQLAMVEDRLNHFDEAVKDFQTLLTIDPKNAAAMNYLGYSWADRGIRLEEAEKLVRQAVAIEPDNGAYVDSLGWVRLKRGDTHEARNLLEKAVLLSPDPLIYDHLGDACLADQHPEAALQAWSKALEMDPKNDVVRKKIQDHGQSFLNSPDGKKYLLYLEGNFKQAQNLAADIVIEGRLTKHALKAEGKLYYEQPDQLELDVPATSKTAAFQFVMKGSSESVTPPETSPILRQMAFQGLSSLSKFLSGRMTPELKATVAAQGGMQTQFSQPDPSGGQDEIHVVSYDFVEGLWLPTEMRVQNSTTGWEANLQFSGWAINQAESAMPFK